MAIFDKPFANSGDREEIPETSQTDNSLSWDDGYTKPYSVTPNEGGKFILRTKFNQIIYLITNEIIQRFKDIAVRFTTGTLTSTTSTTTTATINGATTTNTLNVKNSGTLSTTPAKTAVGKEMVNAEWVRRYDANYELKVAPGYKIWTFGFDMMSAHGVGDSGWLSPHHYFTSGEEDISGMFSDGYKRFAVLGIYPCILVNGVETVKLNPDNFAQDINGNAVDITSLGQDVMIKFPKMGLHIRTKGSLILVSFTNDPNARQFSYAAFQEERIDVAVDNSDHWDSYRTKDAFYVGAYEAYASASKLYSSSGKTPTTSTTIANFRNYARARGDGYGLLGWFQWVYIQACAFFVSAGMGWHVNSTFMGGPGNRTGAVLATGTANAYGMLGFLSTSTNSTVRTDGTSANKYLGLEHLQGNLYKMIDGVIVRNYELLVQAGIKGCNNTGAGYTNTGIWYNGSVNPNGGTSEIKYVAGFAGNDLAGFYPTSIKDVPWGDPNGVQVGAFSQNTGTNLIAVGGTTPYNSICGINTTYARVNVNAANFDTTARLMYL